MHEQLYSKAKNVPIFFFREGVGAMTFFSRGGWRGDFFFARKPTRRFVPNAKKKRLPKKRTNEGTIAEKTNERTRNFRKTGLPTIRK